MSYHGDISLEDTIDIKFTTRRFSTGAPFTLAGTPAISAYVGNSTTEITAGITLSVDFDSRTGLNNVRVVATAANGYTAATNVQLVITAGTVDSVSVVGEVVGSFSIAARSSLRPTVAGRTLDVSAGGEAGVDWANVGSPTTTVGLSGTTVKTATDVETDTADIQARLPAALTAGGNIKADALALSGDTTAADNAEAFFDGTGYAGTGNVIPTVTTLTGHTAQTGDAYARLGAPAGASVSADVAAVKVDTAAILIDTAEIGAAGAGLTTLATAASIAALNNISAAQVATEIADALATDTYAESAAVPAATAALATKISWLTTLARNKITQTATAQVVRNDADNATIATSTLSDDGTTLVRGEFA